MHSRRIGAGLVAAGLTALLTAAPAMAEEPTVTIIPAEPGTADAVALEVGPIKIGHASAQAGSEGSEADSSATGNAVEIGGEAPSEEFGGKAAGKGSKKRGQLVELAEEGMGSVRVTPWDAAVEERDGGGTKSSSSAALLEIIGEGILRVDVMRGEANAEHDGKDSKGFAQSDGARVYLGPENELELIVLHAEARSDNTGETYLVGINGEKIGTAEQGFEACPVTLPELADVSINCVTAGGGEGSLVSEVTAKAVGVGVIPADGQGVFASSTSSKSAKGSAVADAVSPEPAAAPVPAELPAAAPEDSGGLLPRTGSDGMGLLAAAGAAMSALGGVILAIGRRPQLLLAGRG